MGRFVIFILSYAFIIANLVLSFISKKPEAAYYNTVNNLIDNLMKKRKILFEKNYCLCDVFYDSSEQPFSCCL